jgi:protein JSN1
MLSPGSDPFNPFASPTIDLPFFNQNNMRVGSQLGSFEPQPNIGGLGIMNPAQGYYQQNGVS